MALWLTRAGSHGEYEQKFLSENRIYLTWDGLNHDLGKIASRSDLRQLLTKVYPQHTKGCIQNHTGQIWTFSKTMKQGDWVVLPSKLKRAIHIAEIKGDYCYDGKQEDPYFHHRAVKWVATDLPRSNFPKDLLYSFGASMTICEISRHDAEKRVRAMSKGGWKSENKVSSVSGEEDHVITEDGIPDLEEAARDQIANLIMAKFKGHGMARLVDGILRAQGYTTYLSPEGPDKGVDILAAPEPLGFGEPRICVQIKSGDGPLDRPTLDQLIGVMQNLHAQQGLLVSWGGFKSSVDKEKATQFFRVRLWDQNELIVQLLEHYNKLDDDIRADLPLKRIWIVANPEEDDE